MTETVLVQRAIDTDYQIAETFQDLQAARALINHTLMSPGKDALNAVLNYAALTAPLSVRS